MVFRTTAIPFRAVLWAFCLILASFGKYFGTAEKDYSVYGFNVFYGLYTSTDLTEAIQSHRTLF